MLCVCGGGGGVLCVCGGGGRMLMIKSNHLIIRIKIKHLLKNEENMIMFTCMSCDR